MCIASLRRLAEAAHVYRQRVDLLRRQLALEGGHLRLGDAVGDGVLDLFVGGLLVPLGRGEVGRLDLLSFLGLPPPVLPVAEDAALLEDVLHRVLRGGLRSDRGGWGRGGLGESGGERQRDHGAVSSSSSDCRKATRSSICSGAGRAPKSGMRLSAS